MPPASVAILVVRFVAGMTATRKGAIPGGSWGCRHLACYGAGRQSLANTKLECQVWRSAEATCEKLHSGSAWLAVGVLCEE